MRKRHHPTTSRPRRLRLILSALIFGMAVVVVAWRLGVRASFDGRTIWLPELSSPPVLPDAPLCTYRVVAEYPHDPDAFTQGLLYHEGDLYESTGLRGASSVRLVDLDTGRVLKRQDLAPYYFGEGLALWDDRLVQVTWRAETGLVYDRATLSVLAQWTYEGEGWGLTCDDTHIIMSDGTAELRFLDPYTFEESHRVTVRDAQAGLVDQLNELEYVGGQVLANVWQTDRIARIDPSNGDVVGWIDLAGLLLTEDCEGRVDVLNGIAYDRAGRRLLVTGKWWPKLFHIELVPMNEEL